MKLILASQGFWTDEIANSVAELVGKPLGEINLAIINEAYVPKTSDKHWLINELSKIGQYIGGKIDFVNLLAHDLDEVAERLEFANIIYIVGGAQIVLGELFAQTGFDQLLMKLANEKVIMGTSAGSIVLGKLIDNPEYYRQIYDLDDAKTKAYSTQKTLNLVDFNIIPHLGRSDKPKRIAELITPILVDNPFPIYGITDAQAVIVSDNEISFVGGTPAILGKNRIIV